MEREHSQLQLLFVERQQEAATGRTTESFRSRERTHTTTLRKLYRAWVHWQSRAGAGDVRMEASEDDVLGGRFPWEPTAGGSGAPDSLKLALFKTVSELFRTREELMFLQRDCIELASYYSYQRQLLLRRARVCGGGWSPGHAYLVLSKLRAIRALRELAIKAHGAMVGNQQ